MAKKEYEHDALNALRIFTKFCDDVPDLIFYMSRDCDAKMYSYRAQRKGTELKDVSCHIVTCPDFKTEEAIPEVLLRAFFQLNIERIEGCRSKYNAYLRAFSKRTMTLHLKKSGLVTATATMKLPSGDAIHDVDIINIHMAMVYDANDIPDILYLTIFGCVDKDAVPTSLHRHCIVIADDPSMLMIKEIMPITDEMRKQFDLKSLAKEWFLSVTK